MPPLHKSMTALKGFRIRVDGSAHLIRGLHYISIICEDCFRKDFWHKHQLRYWSCSDGLEANHLVAADDIHHVDDEEAQSILEDTINPQKYDPLHFWNHIQSQVNRMQRNTLFFSDTGYDTKVNNGVCVA